MLKSRLSSHRSLPHPQTESPSSPSQRFATLTRPMPRLCLVSSRPLLEKITSLHTFRGPSRSLATSPPHYLRCHRAIEHRIEATVFLLHSSRSTPTSCRTPPPSSRTVARAAS